MPTLMQSAVLDDPRYPFLSFEQMGALTMLAALWDAMPAQDREQAATVLRLTKRRSKQLLAAVWPLLETAVETTAKGREQRTAASLAGVAARRSGNREATGPVTGPVTEPVSREEGASLSLSGTGTSSTCTSERDTDTRARAEATNGVQESARSMRAKFVVVQRPTSVNEDLWRDFLAHRKGKRAPLTETAWKGLVREAGKAGKPIEDVLRYVIERNWVGFQADWEIRGAANARPAAAPRDIASVDYGKSGLL